MSLMKIILFIIGLIIAIWIAIGYFIYSGISTVNEVDNVMESNVSKRVIVEGDTLTIIDYSLVNGTYILSDGGEMYKNFINERIVE